MPAIEIYTKRWCPYCTAAKRLLDGKGQQYTELDIEQDPALTAQMAERSKRRTVPQVFIDGVHIGGMDDLVAAERSGDLDVALGITTAP